MKLKFIISDNVKNFWKKKDCENEFPMLIQLS